jgi:L-ascorbate metabolism protein UlaG (beta-lactamase superfamily)
MYITWLTQGGFMFESADYRIVVDPYMSNSLEENQALTRLTLFPLSMKELRPNVLACTHDHIDHLDPQTVTTVTEAYPECLFAGPVSCCRHFAELGIPADRIVALKQGQQKEIGSFNVLPVFAAHSDPEAVGLLLSAEGKKVYLSGDTTYDERLFSSQLEGCDLMLICINGKLGNMTSDESLKCVKRLKPKTALPMHYGLFAENTADPAPFVAACRAEGVRSFEMESGRTFEI